MSVATFFEKFAGLQQTKAQATTSSYRDVVAGIATGDEPEPTEVERVLAAAGKSVDDLRHDVELFEHRLALKALVASMPNLEAEQKDLRRQIAKADDVLADAEQRHHAATAPLYGRLERISTTLSEAENAKCELYRSCDDAHLLDELQALNVESERLRAQHRNLIDRSTFMDEKSRIERDRANSEVGEASVEGRRALADRYHADAEVARRDAKKLETALSELDKRREQLEEQMRQA